MRESKSPAGKNEFGSSELNLSRIGSNALLMVLARFLGLLTLIVIVPFIIHYIGEDGYGVWELLLAFVGFVTVAQLVISGMLIWQVSLHFISRNFDYVHHLVRVSVFANTTISFFFCLFAYSCSEYLVDVLQISSENASAMTWILPSIIGATGIAGLNQILLAVLIGLQRAGAAAMLQTLVILLTNVASAVGLMLGLGIGSIVIGYILGSGVVVAIAFRLVKRQLPRLSLNPSLPTQFDLKTVGPYLGLLFVSNSTVLFRDHADKIIMASIAGPVVCGYFGMAQRLALIVPQVASVVMTPFTATVAAMGGSGNEADFEDIYLEISGILGILTGSIAMLLISLRRPMLIAWRGVEQPDVYPYLIWLVFGCASAVILTGAGVAFAKAVGKPGLETKYALLTLLLTVVTKPVFVHLFGPVGAVASSAVSWAIGASAFLWFFKRSIPLGRLQAIRPLQILLLTFVGTGIAWCVSTSIPVPATRLMAVLQMCVATPFLLGAYWFAFYWFGICPRLIKTLLGGVFGRQTVVGDFH